jgi:tartrate dehydratase alpha subunit/fumarate hydratase class I-like protein
MELDLIKGLNMLGLGAMGLGGDSTILDVHILNSARHPASLALGLSFNCWALRYTTVRLFDDKIEIISHERENLQI